MKKVVYFSLNKCYTIVVVLFYMEDRIIMPEIFYKEMDKMFEELGIELEDTDDKEKMKQADNFVVTFTPDTDPIIIQ